MMDLIPKKEQNLIWPVTEKMVAGSFLFVIVVLGAMVQKEVSR